MAYRADCAKTPESSRKQGQKAGKNDKNAETDAENYAGLRKKGSRYGENDENVPK